MNVFVVACMGFTIWDEYDAPEFSLLVHFWKVFVYIRFSRRKEGTAVLFS